MYRVILADDEPLILAGIRQRIDWQAIGFTIIAECMDGETLLAAIGSLEPDLLVMDIQMPNLTGIEVMRDIRRVHPIPIIIISGYSDFLFAQEALRYGAVDYLLKPVSTQALHGAVIKAKQQLDFSSSKGKQDSNLLIHFFRENTMTLPEVGMLERLQLSGQRTWYAVTAVQEGVSPIIESEDVEIVRFRYDTKTMLVVLHYDHLPIPIERYAIEQLGLTVPVGIATPFREIRQLPTAADQAYLLLQSAFIKNGVYLWPTEEAAQSVNRFLQQFRAALASRDYTTIRSMLASLPAYLLEHRLNISHFEKIYNTLQYEARLFGREHDEPVLLWHEIIRQYETMDNVILGLESIFRDRSESGSVQMGSHEVISKIRTSIQKDYSRHLSLKNMAAQYHMDKSYLSTLFHSEMGETFTVYLAKVRVEHACDYLKNTQLSHNEIAVLCGFSDDAYLKKVFKKVMQITPSQYRKECRQKSG